jgi:tetratricopeptide (TPR) repeat protein
MYTRGRDALRNGRGLMAGSERPPDFFISRAGADAPFAAEIGRILEAAGHTAVLQQWDFANHNFVQRMHSALESGARVVALLSNEYLASDHCTAEWQNAIAHDPLNRRGRLIVLRVAESTPTGLLAALAYWDLVPVRGDGALLLDIVLTAVKPGRHKDDGVRAAQYWRAPRPIVHREIRATPSFTGREGELSSLHELLWAGHTAAVTQPVAAHGLGGIGKSVLAREYAHRNQGDYAGVWWLNAAKPEDGTPGFDGVERALVDLGTIFIRGLDQAQDRGKAARQTLDLIAHGGFEKPWLLVYDNVDDRAVLRKWAPLGNAQVLVTTRLSGFESTVRTIEIEEWELPDAIRYLRQQSGRTDLTEGGAADIAEELGRLPLALSHAAALLRDNVTITPASYIALLTEHMCEAPEDCEYGRAVFATFKEALVAAERRARGAGAVISLASFFAPDDIPEELFLQPPECYRPALAELASTPGRMERAIGALAHLSLIDFDPQKRAFSAHRLVQAAARDALGEEVPAWSNSALRAIFSAFPVPEFKTWPLCERLVSHVHAVASHVAEEIPELALLLGMTGDYLGGRAALTEVLLLYERVRAAFERLARTDPGNARWQRELSVSHEKIGDVLAQQGNLSAALDSYRASLAIRERLAHADPGNPVWQRDLSVSHEKIGDMLRPQGNLSAALDSYRAALAILERLAQADPRNAHWQRDLSVAQGKIGQVLAAQGDLVGALQSYRASHAIFERLARADPGNTDWQRDLSVSHNKIGDMLRAESNLSPALDSYRASLAIRERLAQADPGNAVWQHDLSVSRDNICQVLAQQGNLSAALESYRASLAIRERLAQADPDNAVWQRSRSVSHNDIGVVLAQQGNLSAALESCRASLAIFERLARVDPGNAEWQRDVSVAQERIGDVLAQQGSLSAALDRYWASLAIREHLARADASNAGWQRDLIVLNVKLAEVAEQAGESAKARRHYQAALGILAYLQASGRLAPGDVRMVGAVATRLAALSPDTAGQ